jgi:chaperonin GroES
MLIRRPVSSGVSPYLPLPDRLRVKKSSGSTEQSEELPAYVPDSQKMEVIIMKLVPLGDRVVLKQLEAETTTKSGIVLPGQEKEKPQQAEVIAVGPGGMVDGKEVKMEVKAGDRVIYSKYSGTEVKVDADEKYVIVRQSDILAIIE